MKRKLIQLFIVNALILQIITGCKKDFLEAKPSSQILQPTTLDDFQGLLDNETTISVSPGLGLLAADEYQFSSYATWQSTQSATERNSYIWTKDTFQGEISGGDWSAPYTSIFYANSVLDGLSNIDITSLNAASYSYIKGWALFVRASAYYDLVRTFSPAYDLATSNSDLGVPIRLKPSIDVLVQRSTVQQTYDRIFRDLNEATPLLGNSLQANRNRPSKIAAYALASRILLSMRDYSNAEKKADSCLQLYNKLIDYNTVSKTAATPFNATNAELLYSKTATGVYNSYVTSTNNGLTQISNEMMSLYAPNDLRLSIFFVKAANGTYDMKRGYRGSGLFPFTGLATDEVYLIKAECAARHNDIPLAMNFLNQLLVNRYPTNTFTPLIATSATDALNKVLLERRKELIWRTLRWDDLKRLNKEGANITLTRILNGQTYTLAPNNPLYVFPIPDNEIQLSGLQQNQR